MNKPLAILCGGLTGLGLGVALACWIAAADLGWAPEADDPERFHLPLETVALAGAVCLVLGPLGYFAAREREGHAPF